MPKLQDLRVKIFADGADFDGIIRLSQNPLIKGFTTNPNDESQPDAQGLDR